jgi:toxin CptA
LINVVVRQGSSPMRIASRRASAFGQSRVVWRPSRWVIVALVAMGLATIPVALVSDMPGFLAATLVLVAPAWAVRLAIREHRRPPRVFMVRPDGAMTLDDMPLEHCTVHWRGPLAFVRARDSDGRLHRLTFWPDVLRARGRRALRLALGGA